MSKARDIARAGTALANVDATELGYLDGVTSSVQTQLDAKAIPANVINNSLVDAKGDILTATADNTPARLAVGSNGYTLVADSSTSTGLAYAGNFPAGKNNIINGGFDIWQRGTSSTATAGGYYTADRYYTAGGGTVTFSQQTDVPSGVVTQYSMRWLTGATTSYGQFYTALESATVKALRGQTMTFSYYIKSGGSHSGNILTEVTYSNSTDALTSQTTNVNPTGDTSYAASTVTSWTRKSVTFTVPTDAVGLRLAVVPNATQASGVSELTTGWQLEIGSTLTPFTRAGGTIQGELAACQRYYYRNTANSAYCILGDKAFTQSATVVRWTMRLPVIMRIAPSTLDYGGTIGWKKFDANYYNATSASIVTSTTSLVDGDMGGFTGLTAGQIGDIFAINSATAYIGISAEL